MLDGSIGNHKDWVDGFHNTLGSHKFSDPRRGLLPAGGRLPMKGGRERCGILLASFMTTVMLRCAEPG